MSVLSTAKVGSPVFKLDISDKQSTVLIWAGLNFSDLILSTIGYQFLCSIDRPNGRVAAICTDKVPSQRVGCFSCSKTVVGDRGPIDYL